MGVVARSFVSFVSHPSVGGNRVGIRRKNISSSSLSLSLIRAISFRSWWVTLWASYSCFSSSFIGHSYSIVSFRHPSSLPSSSSSSSRRLSMMSTSNDSDGAPSLESFLKSRSSVSSSSNIQYVIGNEAGDADSIVSALGWAYVNQQQQQEEEDNTHWIPIVSIPRSDIRLRPDVNLLFQILSTTTTKDETCLEHMLLFMDDPLPTTSSSDSSLGLTLVDHNKRSSRHHHDSSIMDSIPVTEIVDHHRDEGCHTDTTRLRTIAFQEGVATVGSTCTLVVEHITTTATTIHPQMALALLSVILLDTMNMNVQAGKGTPRDATAIQTLLSLLPHDFLHNLMDDYPTLQTTTSTSDDDDGDETLNCQALFDMLQNAKFDVHFWNHQLNAKDALRMDYKQFTPPNHHHHFGLSSVLLPMKDFISKSNVHSQTMQFMTDCDISVLGILTFHIHNDDTPQREFALVVKQDSTHPHLLQDLTNYLLHNDNAKFLQMTIMDTTTTTTRHDNQHQHPHSMYSFQYFHQGNPKGSRKQVAPVLLDYFSKTNQNETTEQQQQPQEVVDSLTEYMVIEFNQKLLNSIANGDYDTYSQLCAHDLTCFEPESCGMLIQGLDFHKYYFDLSTPTLTDNDNNNHHHQIHMSHPHVRLLGNVAIISYTRVDQTLDANTNMPVTKTMSETRVWELQSNGRIIHVHFHKSSSSS